MVSSFLMYYKAYLTDLVPQDMKGSVRIQIKLIKPDSGDPCYLSLRISDNNLN